MVASSTDEIETGGFLKLWSQILSLAYCLMSMLVKDFCLKTKQNWMMSQAKCSRLSFSLHMHVHTKSHTFSYMQTYLHICTHTDRHIQKHIPFVFSLVRWKSGFMNREYINSIVLNCGRYVSVDICGNHWNVYSIVH